MSSVFSLKSDNEFITPASTGEGICVYSYKGDMNDVKIIRTSFSPPCDPWCSDQVCVGPKGNQYKALEVFGTTIEGDKLKELVHELTAIENIGIYVLVNRLGLCIITEIEHPSIRAMRINDYFGWSKYGVEVPRDMLTKSINVWNRLNMFNGEVVISRSAAAAEEEASNKELRRSLEEKSAELKACKEELERSKKMESVLGKLAEGKEKEVEVMKNQLLAFKATLRSLADH